MTEKTSREIAQEKIDAPLSPVVSADANAGRVPFGGGVVVGTNSDAVTGPLANLYRHGYSYTNLIYPLDVGSPGKGHTVQFDISDIKPVKLENIGENVDLLKNQVTKAFGAEVESGGAGIKQTVKQGLEQAQAAVDKIAGNTLGTNTQKLTDTLVNAPKLNFAPATTNTVATIRLTMPDTLNFSYGVQYDKLSVADAAGSVPLVGTIAKAITSAASSGLGKLAMNKLGYAFNPQEQQVFEGIDFREYEMTFVFTPISDKEARTIKEIIKTFRKHAAPTIVGAGGFFFNPPSVFDVSFFQNGQPNYNLNAIRRSVITNISVDYAPNGWSAFKNGAPVQTTMTISFKETELVDRTSIESER